MTNVSAEESEVLVQPVTDGAELDPAVRENDTIARWHWKLQRQWVNIPHPWVKLGVVPELYPNDGCLGVSSGTSWSKGDERTLRPKLWSLRTSSNKTLVL